MMPIINPNEDPNDSDNSGSESGQGEEVTYYEESSESESEMECDVWDIDCKLIPKRISSIIGYHLLPTCSRDPDLLPKKKIKLAPEINKNILNKFFIEEFKDCWRKNVKLLNDNTELIADPFQLCVMHNFLENQALLEEVREEFYELDWNCRNMDLYEFFQSKDLKYLNFEQIRNIFQFLKIDVMKLVSELTGLSLTHMSATCSIYTNTDYLLVHDDQREDRAIAFILYLTGNNGWTESKGGALQLFNKDKLGQPFEAVRNIFPVNNQLIFFPVTNDSYHQVVEITTLEDCRLSINGWFHTKVQPVFETPLYAPLENSLYNKNNIIKVKEVDIALESWINEDYLELKAISLIQRHIEENSEISLKNFFRQESFNEILQTLKDKDTKWLKVGPPNRYSYEIIDTSQLPHSLERFLSLFQCTEMFKLLQCYTDLELMGSNASMKFELQRWTPHSYALLTDYNWQEKNELDLIIYFGCNKSSDVIGARTQYVTIEDEVQNALITLEPEENNLNIVYRDSARFTRYFSEQSNCQCFYMLICSYSE